ncbi:MAG: hypothetical protein H0X25_21185 [Acidobacteriales bacterium]|nr:hypothetical protein [Terriglobales bacterium]
MLSYVRHAGEHRFGDLFDVVLQGGVGPAVAELRLDIFEAALLLCHGAGSVRAPQDLKREFGQDKLYGNLD